MIQAGTPQADLPPEARSIIEQALKEGKDKQFTEAALILSKPEEERKRINPEWLHFVVQHEQDLRDQAHYIFDETLEEFLRRVHAGKAAGQ